MVIAGLSGAFFGGVLGYTEGLPLLGALAGTGLFAAAVLGIAWVTGAFSSGRWTGTWIPSGGTEDSTTWLSVDGDAGGDAGDGDG